MIVKGTGRRLRERVEVCAHDIIRHRMHMIAPPRAKEVVLPVEASRAACRGDVDVRASEFVNGSCSLRRESAGR